MKLLFSFNRLFLTFSLYIVIIIIPLIIMVYVGRRSLDDKKHRIEEHASNLLAGVGNHLRHDLFSEWELFLREELFRKYYHYQAVQIDDEHFDGESQLVRSPLYATVDNLNRLSAAENIEANPSRPSVADIIDNSLQGYFSFDVAAGTFTSPYDLTTAIELPTTSAQNTRNELVAQYQHFLNQEMRNHLWDRLEIQDSTNFRPLVVLRRLRSNIVSKESVATSKIQALARLVGDSPTTSVANDDPTQRVYYYDFRFSTITWENSVFVVGFRPVMVSSKLLVQGFLINTTALIQETQSYLEYEQQYEYGSVVLEESPPILGQPLFAPFQFLVISYKTNEDKGYLRSYREDKQYFFSTIIFLSFALGLSMVHLGSLIYGHMDLNRKKNNFISAITHELKAPLTSIMIYAEMLEEGWAGGKEHTYYQHIRWESERLSRLIRNILDYSGLERGNFRLQRSPLELDSFVADTLSSLKDWVDQEGLKLVLDIQATPVVLVDKDSLSQVLYNLCDNAIKYGMGNEMPRLTVAVTELEENAMVTIYDNGTGIPKDEEVKVFRRFYRIQNEMTRESTGTGLGLALVKDIVEGNGGEVMYFRCPDASGFGVRMIFPKMEDEALAALVEQEFPT